MTQKMMLACFCGALLLSAALLFSVQPMTAKMLLPLYGGSPAVWTTCMVFYQVVLLAGYLYAHLASRWLGPRLQSVVHLVVVAAPLLMLPIAIPENWTPSGSGSPTLSLLLLLAWVVGVPLFVVSSTAPLLQKWFSRTSHSAAQDPYFLYAASNAGSMLALLSYPILIEPALRLGDQTAMWTIGYIILMAGIAACATLAWRLSSEAKPESSASKAKVKRSRKSDSSLDKQSVSHKDRFYWTLLAFVPSSWLLAATTHLTTDIAPIPLLWIIPLALYLLTFILVFARSGRLSYLWVVRLFPFAMILLVVSLIMSGRWQLLGVHLLAFFLGAMVCHGELARRRPATRYLTEFYLWMAVGGALGGVFNALIAPLVFPVLLEFPIAVALGCWLHPGRPREATAKWDLVALASLAVGVALLVNNFKSDISGGSAFPWFVMGMVPVLVVLYFVYQPKWFAAVLAVVLVWNQFHVEKSDRVLITTRSFFGVHRVILGHNDQGQQFHRLRHGSTVHGLQNILPEAACEPLGYYHRQGPLAALFDTHPPGAETQHVAVIGLGAGTTACYLTPQRYFTFYEIDSTVKRIAEDPKLFTYLSECGQGRYEIVLGDGRMMMASAEDHRYSIIILDAFSSDAIPTHLLTRQALALYLSKLTEDGVLAFHISNKHLDLSGVLGDLAADAHLVGMIRHDMSDEKKILQGFWPSSYVVMARRTKDLGALIGQRSWQPLQQSGAEQPWTDDYSNILSILKWDPRYITTE